MFLFNKVLRVLSLCVLSLDSYGDLMAKFDVESASRNIAVDHSDRCVLGMKGRGQYYVDFALLRTFLQSTRFTHERSTSNIH